MQRAPSRGYVRRHPLNGDHLLRTPKGVDGTELHTMLELQEWAWKHWATRDAMGTRRRTPAGEAFGAYQFETFATVGAKARAFASGLRHLGVAPRSFVGFYCKNSPEVLLFDLACALQSYVSVGLYDTLGPDALEYICNHAELASMLTNAAQTARLIASLPRCPTLRVLVQVEPLSADQQAAPFQEQLRAHKVLLLDFAAVVALGKANPAAPTAPQPGDLLSLLYTSGTTGVPKGVMLTHANAMACIAGFDAHRENPADVDVHLSYLPMAHIYERMALWMCALRGGVAGFYGGDLTRLLEDIQALRPTVLAGVPRVYQRIHDRVQMTVAQSLPHRRWLFSYAVRTKTAALERGEQTPWLDRLVFSKIRDRLGGRIRLMGSGSAPLSAELQRWLQVCFCCTVIQGYGLSETAAAATASRESDTGSGHVGVPASCCEVVLESVPEMNYHVEDRPFPRGEVLIRGPNVFTGYYKDEKQTREAFTDDGWFRSGDVGEWRTGGLLAIIDRKKNIFKLAQGEYVAAEKLENIYVASPLVMSVWIYGDSARDCLVAVVHPDPDALLPWARTHLPAEPATMEHLCRHSAVRAAVLADMVALGRQAGVMGFELPQAVHLDPNEWTPETGIVTPTLKLKRPSAKEYFQPVLDQMYREIQASRGAPVARL